MTASEEQQILADVSQPESKTYQVSFTGSGSEYFRIWIVNLLLSIVTLGIYSAWAKVRRNQYFYSCTHIAEGSFDYHGNAIAILKGRIAAIVILTLYNIAVRTSGTYTLIMLVILGAILPWLIWRSLQFRLYNSSYRAIRFGFRGSAGQAYMNFLLWPVLTLFTIYLLFPFAHQRIKKFQHSESRFGTTYFSFYAKVSSFYGIYLIGFISAIVAGIVAYKLMGSPFAGIQHGPHTERDPASFIGIFMFMLAFYGIFFLIFPLILTMMQNLIWNNTKLGDHQFHSDLRWGKMTFIIITNILGVICTLGLFTPFAHIRYLKYKLEAISLTTHGSLDNFVSAVQDDVSATGVGMTDMLDFDLSL